MKLAGILYNNNFLVGHNLISVTVFCIQEFEVSKEKNYP